MQTLKNTGLAMAGNLVVPLLLYASLRLYPTIFTVVAQLQPYLCPYLFLTYKVKVKFSQSVYVLPNSVFRYKSTIYYYSEEIFLYRLETCWERARSLLEMSFLMIVPQTQQRMSSFPVQAD
jgi:hypothetical protein